MVIFKNKTRTKNPKIHEEEENKTLRPQVRWGEEEGDEKEKNK